MQDESRYGVGIDIGTNSVRVAVGVVKPKAAPAVVAYSEVKNTGMRKGVIVDIDRTAEAIDKALMQAEKMVANDFRVKTAFISVNGSHIGSLSSRGSVSVPGKEVSEEDVYRAQDDARLVSLSENCKIIDLTPRNYTLGDQENIKDPVGMTGVRLEVDAFIITAFEPHIRSLEKTLDLLEMAPGNCKIVFSGVAAAQATLTTQQKENGVACVDIGGTTTTLTVYDEGELLHTAVLPVGSNNITNDLAIGLKTELDIAERVKLEYAVATPAVRKVGGRIRIKTEKEMHTFDTEIVDEIVGARVEEIFEMVNLELKKIGRLANLPGGVTVTGGGAQMKGMAEAAKDIVQLSARIGKPPKFGGFGEKIARPSWATALGLMELHLDTDLMTYGENNNKSRGFWSFLKKK